MFGNKRAGWLGVDWGTRAIKLACLERTPQGYRFTRKAIVRRTMDPGITGESELMDPGRWNCDDFPSGLVRERWFAKRQAACVLPMHLADFRTLDLPVAEPQVRRAMAAGELADALEETPGERIFDLWDPPPGAGNRTGSFVQVLSLPQSLATRVAECLARSGLDCEVLDGLPFTLARALDLAEGPTESGRIALDWGYCGATICVLRGATPIYSRLLRGCGLFQLASAVGASLGVNVSEAEDILVKCGLPGDSVGMEVDDEVRELTAQVVADPLRQLVEQIDKTLLYVENEWPGVHSDRIWLFGGAATIPNLARQLAEKIGLDVVPWRLGGSGRNEDPSEVLFASAAALSALAWNR